MVARLDGGDGGADLAYDPRPFMAEDRGEKTFAVKAVEHVGVGVANTHRHDLDEYLACLGTLEINPDDCERLRRSKSTSAHRWQAAVTGGQRDFNGFVGKGA